MGPEARIEHRTATLAMQRFGIPSTKWGQDGWPDRVFWIPGGSPLLIEFKSGAPESGVDARQAQRIEHLTLWGYDVEVHNNAEQAIEAIRVRVEAARRKYNRRSSW